MSPAEHVEERVLALVPNGPDASLICEMLLKAGIPREFCENLEDFSLRLREGAAVGLLSEEALNTGGAEILFAELKAQPVWSDLPFLLLTGAGSTLGPASVHLMEVFGESANITILEWPIRT